MSKGLEALEELKFQVGNITFHTRDLQITTIRVRDCGLFETIGKELKALEIIREKSINTRNLTIYCFEMNDAYKDYVEAFEYHDNYWELGKELLAEEEYNLLKEVLL